MCGVRCLRCGRGTELRCDMCVLAAPGTTDVWLCVLVACCIEKVGGGSMKNRGGYETVSCCILMYP